MNWELIKNRYDPGNEIAWLEQELASLEAIGGQAILITHIPLNKDCVHGWGHRYRGLMERYQHIIRFTLMGHTHRDEFHVTRSINASKNIGYSIVAGSLTSFTNLNPSFLVIELDEELLIPLNVKTYIMNLTRANLDGYPTWEYSHDFLEEYGVPDMSPDSLYDVGHRILIDQETSDKYNNNRFKRFKKYPPNNPAIKKQLYCDVTTSEFFERRICMGDPLYDWDKDPMNAMMNLALNTWVKKQDGSKKTLTE